MTPWIVLTTLAVPLADPSPAASVCGTAADEFIAADAGLVREWIVQVPFDSAGWRLEHVVVGRDIVVAQSRDGVVAAIQSTAVEHGPRPGRVLWSQRLGTPGGVSLPAGIGPDTVAVARDLDIYALDLESGHVTWREPLDATADAGPTILGAWVYVPVSGQISRLPLKPLRAPVSAATAAPITNDGVGRRAPQRDAIVFEELNPLVRSSIASGERVPFPVDGSDKVVFWVNARGTIGTIERLGRERIRSEFDLNASPAGSPVVRGRTIYTAIGHEASGNPTLARVELMETGVERLRWEWWTTLPDRPDQGPMVSGDTVVVSLGPSGLAAYSATTGDPLWRSCIVGTIVAAGGERVWVHDEVGRLSGIDLATGIAREWLALGCLTVPVVNTTTDRLVLASPGGLVVSLAPATPSAPTTPAAAEPTTTEKPGAEPATDAAEPASDPADPATEPAAGDPDATPP